jgi:hypothetical protein
VPGAFGLLWAALTQLFVVKSISEAAASGERSGIAARRQLRDGDASKRPGNVESH